MPAEMQMSARMMLMSVAMALPSCSGIVSGLGQVSPQIESQVNNKANANKIVLRKNRKFMLVSKGETRQVFCPRFPIKRCFTTWLVGRRYCVSLLPASKASASVRNVSNCYCSQGGTSALGATGAANFARKSASVRTSLPR